MIPKIIHYCWFGENPLPDTAIKYIDTWKKYCPTYEIREWNEKNFDINCCTYVKEAYENKKWAFVTDYVRLYALVNYGGIYMDTDVEVLKSLDKFLDNRAFSGFEKEDAIPTGIMGCEQGNELFNELLHYYDNRHFVDNNGQFDMTTNVQTITNMLLKKGLKLNNTFQVVEGFALYPKDYFCPKDYETGLIDITSNTYTIHHFNASWHSKYFQRASIITGKIVKKYGVSKGKKISYIVTAPLKVCDRIYEDGFIKAINHYLRKIRNSIHNEQ